MKRSHQLIKTQTDPYVQFRFEQSLRKYQASPNKKIKVDHSFTKQFFKNTHFNSQKSNVSYSPLKFNQRGKEKDISTTSFGLTTSFQYEFKGQPKSLLPQISPSKDQQNMQRLNSIDENQNINFEEKQLLRQYRQNDKQIDQSLPKLELQNQEQPINQHQTNNIIQTPNQIFFIESINDICCLEPSQHHNDTNMTASIRSSLFLGGGRVNLSSKVIVSQRSLEKMIKGIKSVDEVVEALLSKRTYLASEKEEIKSFLTCYLQKMH